MVSHPNRACVVSQIIHKIHRLPGIGRVIVEANDRFSGFFARAFPDRDTARESAIQEMSKQGASPSVDAFAEAWDRHAHRQIAFGAGKRADIALAALLAKLEDRKVAPRRGPNIQNIPMHTPEGDAIRRAFTEKKS